MSSFWSRSSRDTTPSPNVYGQVPQQDPGYGQRPPRSQGLPTNPQSSQYRSTPGGYNDAPESLFGGRRQYDQRQPDPRMPSYDQGGYGGRPSASRSAQRGRRQFTVVRQPSEELALTNRLIVHRSDFPNGQYITVFTKDTKAVFTVLHDPSPPGHEKAVNPGEIGIGLITRQWLPVSLGQLVDVEAISSREQLGYLQSLCLFIDFVKKGESAEEQYSVDDITETILPGLDQLAVNATQTINFEYHGRNLKGTLHSLGVAELAEGTPNDCGIIMANTDITILKDESSKIKLKGSAKKVAPNSILKPDFKFQDMGIGGLDTEFGDIFRRAFASRVFPPGLVEKLGIQHVKGILLHGPPGTGKTLIARQIGKVLNAREPKIVNGPEILNKYVGASEENIRKLFADAEAEYKAKAEESGLHIIIFDELDAIFKQRGSTNNGTGVGDSVVNQLLSKMDGVDQLNNILIIGMTNRKDMIDEALLRPGRLEVHMEISLPDEKGRQQILNIHTLKMRTNGVMDGDVDITELAALTKNFSGAEIAGLIKDATSFAFNRHIKVGTMAGVSDVENLRVNRDDFMRALEEVKPAFGVSEEEIQGLVRNGIIRYNDGVDEILRVGKLFVEQVRTSTRTPLVSVLIYGQGGSGKTAVAASIAQASAYPFIKLISPDTMAGYTEGQKIAAITRVFNDSYKSPLSVIVVDSIERLIDWTPLGARFSNTVLQTLLVLFARQPPKGRRLLILATTSIRPIMKDLGVADVFDSHQEVEPIRKISDIEYVLREIELFESDSDLLYLLEKLKEAKFEGKDEYSGRTVGIKKLLSMVEMVRQEPESAVARLHGLLTDK